jgi:hypothetical protein
MADKTRVLIQDVTYDPGKRWWRIAQQVTAPDGTTHRILHAIADHATVNHAAEYGLDPHDSATVVDWLLHERFAPPPADPTVLCPYRNPPQQAWAAHQERLAEVKTRVEIADPDGHLGKIHAAHRPTKGDIATARHRVTCDRAHVAHLMERGATR